VFVSFPLTAHLLKDLRLILGVAFICRIYTHCDLELLVIWFRFYLVVVNFRSLAELPLHI
jgi:hypothetical protein